jgi:hypothetical protein
MRMMPRGADAPPARGAAGGRAPGGLGLALAATLGGGAAAAQAPPPPVRFVTGDGSRVLLLPGTGPPVVHWAIASPCGPLVDPETAPGLAAACALVSLAGTWQTGSFDARREAAALAALDAAEADLASAPRTDGKAPDALVTRADELRAAAGRLADPLAWRRVMLAAPVIDLRVATHEGAAVLSLTTMPTAVPSVAKLLLERREHQALRGVRGAFETARERATAVWDADPLAPLRAEALALAFPGSPLARGGDRPPSGGFTRAQALATWAASQHPSRTVHVLTGNFEPATVETLLRAVFQETALPPPPAAATAPRPAAAVRRAIVPGARHPAIVIAWPLQDREDPRELALLAGWFGVGADSWLGRELQRRGRRGVKVHAQAPWPPGAPGGLFEIEVTDAAGSPPGLADQVLALCRATTKKAPREGELDQVRGTVLAEWSKDTQRGADLAAQIARTMLLHPGLQLPGAPLGAAALADLPARLQRILDGTPIVVEWRAP